MEGGGKRLLFNPLEGYEMTMQKKILLFIIVVILVPMVLIANRINKLYLDMLERKVLEVSGQTLTQISNNVDMLINNMISASNVIALDNEAISILEKEKAGYREAQSITDKLVKAQGSVLYAYNSDMVLYDFHGNYYTASGESAYQNMEEVTKEEWFQKTLELDGFVYWTSPDENNLEFSNYPPGTFCMSRVIKGRSYAERYGVLLVCVSPYERQSDFWRIKDGSLSGDFYVADNNDIVIMSSNETMLGSNLKEKGIDSSVLTGNTGKREIVIQGKNYIVNYIKNTKSSFKIIQCIQEQDLVEEGTGIRKLNVIVNVLLILILLVFSFVFSRSITRPVTELCSSMKLVGEGDFTQSISVQGNNEIAAMAQNYNVMINKIQKLVTELEKSYLQRENLRYKALQAQINPHFILNTLNGIRMLAMINGDEKVAAMIMELGKMLEHLLGRNSEMVCLKEEVACIESYCELQKMRYGDTFKLELQIEEDVQDFKVPILLLQPLIENAIIHGSAEAVRFGKIKINGYREGEFVVIEVRDNGNGISEKEIETILSMEKEGKATGIGIKNVSDRVRLIYGKESSLQINSVVEEGTAVKIVMYDAQSRRTVND